MASLRLFNRTRADWAYSAEGFLIVYDPSVVTERVFKKLKGLQTLAPMALQWMLGGGTTIPVLDQPEHWGGLSRVEIAERLALLVELGWKCSLSLLPLTVALNGADIHLRDSALTVVENKSRREAFRAKHHRGKLETCRGRIIARKPRLAVTWDFMLGFAPAEKRELFGPGYEVEFAWAAGAYQLTGWTLPDREDEANGQILSEYVVQFEPWSSV